MQQVPLLSPLKDFPLYAASPEGTVYSLAPSPTPLKPQLKKGYHTVNVYRNGRMFTRSVHHLILADYVPRPAGAQCRHLNGIRTDNRLENLAWGTAKENAADRDRHGTTARLCGEQNSQSKLSRADIDLIRIGAKHGISRRVMAETFDVHINHIGDICRGRRWACA